MSAQVTNSFFLHIFQIIHNYAKTHLLPINRIVKNILRKFLSKGLFGRNAHKYKEDYVHYIHAAA